MYIKRELLTKICKTFQSSRPQGLILSGIVGCGKTTLINHCLEELAANFEIFKFNGDESLFRQKIIDDSSYLLKSVKSKTGKRSLIFVDEVQKCEEIFDALKIAFDSGDVSFIVSGSNPAYLSTIAKKRLQRRADQIFMLPLSLSEILVSENIISTKNVNIFQELLWGNLNFETIEIPKISIDARITQLIPEFFIYGGLPLSFLSEFQTDKLKEIKLTVERGFDLFSIENNKIAETVKVELAHLQSQEFSYKHILEKTRTRQRSTINLIIDDLINHGYIVKRSPYLFNENKTTYLSIFSYIDPGIVSYLTGEYNFDLVKGPQVEGYCHSRLSYLSINSSLKSEIYYYKPFEYDQRKNIRYLPGEVDLIFKHGKRIIPIEVKASADLNDIKTNNITNMMTKHKLPFAVILYGGVPYIDKKLKIIYWPYWMV